MSSAGIAIGRERTHNLVFEPPEAFSQSAHIGSMTRYRQLCREAETDPDRFWGAAAGDLHWFKPWDKVLEWNRPWAKWFVGGKLNVSYNCLDRQIALGRGDKRAIIWEGEPGDTRVLTY